MKYKRVLLKLSGEALMGNSDFGIEPQRLDDYTRQVIEVNKLGVQVAIVIGGGNIFRGVAGVQSGFDRVKGDYMGMLATVINSLALQSSFESQGQKARLFTAINMQPVGERFIHNQAIEALENGQVIIIAGGTGNPFFTTDTASTLRAVEIKADAMLKGTRVDGVYSADPEKDKSAVKYQEISFDEVYQKGLKVMDLTAFTMCKENNLPVVVFDMNKEGNLKKLLEGENVGTVVSNE